MKYHKKILNNGMTLIFVPIKYSKIVSMGFFVKAGSRNETEENNGIAHFLEHMMFKGTQKRTTNDLYYQLDQLGTLYNAATAAQHTYYYIYGNVDDTKKILDIILDIYLNAIFETKEINNEKKIILEEMRIRYDSPYMKLFRILHTKLFAGTSLARSVIGTEENIENFKKNDLTNFRKKLYRPDNTIFVITGNFNYQVIYRMISKILGNLENPDNEIPNYKHEKEIIMKTMMKQKEPYVYIKKNNMMQQAYIIMAFPMYDLYKTKNREIDMLSLLLTSGSSSRLIDILREKKGIVYNMDSYPIVYSDASVFIIQMSIQPDKLIDGLKILFRELRKIKRNLILKEEMKKIYNITKNESIYALSKPIDYLVYFGLNFLYDRYFQADFEGDLKKLKKIKRTSIREIAKKIFVRNKINLFIYGNIKQRNYDFIDL